MTFTPARWLIRWQARRAIIKRLDTTAPTLEIRRLPPPQSLHLEEALNRLRGCLLGRSPAERGETWEVALLSLESSILHAGYELSIRDPLSVIVYQCGRGGLPDDKLAWACTCAAEWARAKGFFATMLFFNHAAAAASDSIAYYLIAELAAVSVDLNGLAASAHPRTVRRLTRRRQRLAEWSLPRADSSPSPHWASPKDYSHFSLQRKRPSRRTRTHADRLPPRPPHGCLSTSWMYEPRRKNFGFFWR